MNRYIKWLFIVLFLVFIAEISFAQNPAIQLVPYDSLELPISNPVGLDVINYNNDEYPDYFYYGDRYHYNNIANIIDGYSGETIWQSDFWDTEYLTNIVHLESEDIWRLYAVNTNDFYVYSIYWVEPPNVHMDYLTNVYLSSPGNWDYSWWNSYNIGYLNGIDKIYVHCCNGWAVDIGEAYYYGEIYSVDEHNHDNYFRECGRYINNEEFVYNGEYYLLHIGDYYHEEMSWVDPWIWYYDYYAKAIIMSENQGIDYSYEIYHNDYCHLDVKADMFQQDQNTPPMQLYLMSEPDSYDKTLIVYDNIFDSTSFVSCQLFLEDDYNAKFFIFNNEVKIFTYNEYYIPVALNSDLSLYGEIFDINSFMNSPFHFEDIDDDGTDEFFFLYRNMVYIYKAEETVGIDETSSPLPCLTTTSYPNPFNASTTISYDLPEKADISLEIYDILGRKIEMLISTTQPAGHHQAVWHAGDLPSGVYFYKLTTGEHTRTEKMVLMK